MCCCECASDKSFRAKQVEEHESGEKSEVNKDSSEDYENNDASDEDDNNNNHIDKKSIQGYRQMSQEHKSVWPTEDNKDKRKIDNSQEITEISKGSKPNPKNGPTSEMRIAKTIKKSKVTPKSSSSEKDYAENRIRSSPKHKEKKISNIIHIKEKEAI